MTKLNEVYKCQACGNIVNMTHSGEGELICCGSPMDLMEENKVDASLEKHVPVLEKTDNGYKVAVGSVLHPMEDEHYIEWIELLADKKSYKVFLKPGDEPVAEFCVEASEVKARAYCNLHGLWAN